MSNNNKISEKEEITNTGENTYTKGLSTEPLVAQLDQNKQSFADCYDATRLSLWNNDVLHDFISCLRKKAIEEWKYVKKIRNTKSRITYPGGFLRPTIIGKTEESPNVRPLDRTRIVALLDALDPKGPLSPEILDKATLANILINNENAKKPFYTDRCTKIPLVGLGDAYKIIETRYWVENWKNCYYKPLNGPIVELSDALVSGKDWDKFGYLRPKKPLFGEKLSEGMGFDEYFSLLLDWDDKHCYGLWIALGFIEMHGGNNLTFEAARDWIFEKNHYNNYIYSRYPDLDDHNDWEHSKFK